MRFCAGDAVPGMFTAAGGTGAVDGLWSRKCCVAGSARIEDWWRRCAVPGVHQPPARAVHPRAARTHAGGAPEGGLRRNHARGGREQ